jgi:hypothetical protein
MKEGCSTSEAAEVVTMLQYWKPILLAAAMIVAAAQAFSGAIAQSIPAITPSNNADTADGVAARWAEIQERAKKFEAARTGQLLSAAPSSPTIRSIRFKQALEQAEKK